MKRHLMAAFVAALCAASTAGAVPADGGFEFSYKPALDGAGYMVQPLSNVRASGNMAILTTDPPLSVPLVPGPNVSAAGRGIDNGGGTFSYVGAPGVAMGFIQGVGTGAAGDPPVKSPLVNQKTFTLEGRFKVSGGANGEVANHDFFAFENNALGSVHFTVAYGRLGSDGNGTLALSGPGAPFVSSDGAIPLAVDTFVKLRVVTSPVGATQGSVATYIDLEDGNGWRTGPGVTYAPSTTRDRGSLVRALSAGASENTNVEVDYIRWKAARLTTSDALAAVPEPSSALLLGLAGVAALARRRQG